MVHSNLQDICAEEFYFRIQVKLWQNKKKRGGQECCASVAQLVIGVRQRDINDAHQVVLRQSAILRLIPLLKHLTATFWSN